MSVAVRCRARPCATVRCRALPCLAGDGVVDFAEFVAFYVTACFDAKKSEAVMRRRHKAEQLRKERERRRSAYVDHR